MSKKRCHSASSISSNALRSKMPRLLTRISTAGKRLTSSVVGPAADRSPAKLSTFAFGVALRIRSDASFDGCFGAAVDDDPGAFGRQQRRNGKADALGGAGNQCRFVLQLEIHAACSPGLFFEVLIEPIDWHGGHACAFVTTYRCGSESAGGQWEHCVSGAFAVLFADIQEGSPKTRNGIRFHPISRFRLQPGPKGGGFSAENAGARFSLCRPIRPTSGARGPA